MKTNLGSVWLTILLVVIAGCQGQVLPTAPPTAVPSPRPVATAATTAPTFAPTPQPSPTPTVAPTPTPADPFTLISRESLFAFVKDLTSIQPYSGWRNSGTEGEREAQDYVEKKLDEMAHLRNLGMKIERQTFRVFMATELWESRLFLHVNGKPIEVPASGLRGDRDNLARALRFDSDGVLNDRDRNPVTVNKGAVLVRTEVEIRNLTDAQNKIVFVDYAALDRSIMRDQDAGRVANALLTKQPAAIVLVTKFSNKPGESHGGFVGDVSILNWMDAKPAPPTLYVRLEDLASAGITNWSDFARVESARLIWDADVFSPATSGNLVARIPGADSSRAVILGAHIDSPNSPGAMDDGSGSAILLEVARVINAARVQPPIDLYLVWFGSEELGLYGSQHFVATHQELLDQTVAMLQIDCLARPLDGISADLELEAWSYGRLGNKNLPWLEYLTQTVARQGIKTKPVDMYSAASDNGSFGGFDVPNANLIYLNSEEMSKLGSIHYAAHFHDPYDTVELAREVADVFEQMARVALTAALNAHSAPVLRVTPPATHRALFVASHTEPVHIAPTTFTELGMALAFKGFDVDMIPYGRAVTPADLKSIDLVIVLPVLDHPSPDGNPNLYDEAWMPEEITALERYVADGGFLVLTNSARRFKYVSAMLDPNEDWSDMNALAERFGVTFAGEPLPDKQARVESGHPLMEDVSTLVLPGGNNIPFTMSAGRTLAEANGKLVIALKDHQRGRVLVLSDVGILSAAGDPKNLRFWQDLASFATTR